MDVGRVGPHEIVPFPRGRNATIDTLRWARKRLSIPLLLEVDVTDARRAIRAFRSRTGKGLSLTAWVVSCVARAAAEHPHVHAIRLGRRRLAVFHDVDVAVLVERAVEDGESRETLPMPFVVRKANEKQPAEIHEEIQRAREAAIPEGTASIGSAPSPRLQSLFFRLPDRLRDLVFWRWLFRSPARIKRTMGTVVVTSVGMAAPGVLAWGIPAAIHPLAVAVGGVARRRSATGDAEMLALTLVFDHAVTDGAPVGRFVRRLNEILTRAEVSSA
jgi:pyruvate/2-oxoglutarate dehydrogenase complex dihydrolipoamide acyltransferase (E2) component